MIFTSLNKSVVFAQKLYFLGELECDKGYNIGLSSIWFLGCFESACFVWLTISPTATKLLQKLHNTFLPRKFKILREFFLGLGHPAFIYWLYTLSSWSYNTFFTTSKKKIFFTLPKKACKSVLFVNLMIKKQRFRRESTKCCKKDWKIFHILLLNSLFKLFDFVSRT